MPDVRPIDLLTTRRPGAPAAATLAADPHLFPDPDVARLLGAPGFAKAPMDARIAVIAQAQFGVVSRRQLRWLGLTAAGIDARVRRGALHVLHRGVYAVGHRAVHGFGLEHAALLACPPGTPRSHRTAGVCWNLRAWGSRSVEVTIPGWGKPKPGLVVHRHRLHPDDVTRLDGLLVTTVARTIFDLAESLREEPYRRVWEDAARLQLLDPAAIRTVAARNPGRHALARVGPMVAGGLPTGLELTRSPFEADFLVFQADWLPDIPPPLVNARVCGYEIDIWYPGARLAVELDSRQFHDNDPAFERDRAKWNALVAAGIVVFPLTSRRLRREPGLVAEQLAAALRARARDVRPTDVP